MPTTPIEIAVPTFAVAIPTRDRIGYVQLTSSALRGTFPSEDVWIFDDQSTEYSTAELQRWYGTAHVWQSATHLKADAMSRHILEWFLTSTYDVLVLMDSDLIVAPTWLSALRTGLREASGLLSLYRSGAPQHRSLSCGDVLCRQPSMGNAGTVWRRALAARMLSEVSARDGGFDWSWSEWCTAQKVPMEALKASAVLHIGMHGSWSHESSAEKSIGFPMDELSAGVQKQARHFLAGKRPKKVSAVHGIHINGGTTRIACDVPCFWPSSLSGIVSGFRIDELGVSMLMSMEGEEYYPSLKLSNRRKDHFIASTRMNSDIPMPYFNWPWTLYMDKTPSGDDIWSKNSIQTPHVPLTRVKRAAVFIARNCHSKSNRERWVKQLMQRMPVESVSSCLHNTDMANRKDKLDMMKQYAMYFAFENQRVDDYITEKLWNTFRAGVLPVYFGAPNIREHVPEHSIVNVDDFESVDELAKHLKEIMENEELYNSYHAWRYKPLPEWFVRKYNFTHVHSRCRTCRWASAKLRGLDWDAEQQQVVHEPSPGARLRHQPIPVFTPFAPPAPVLWVIPAFKRAWSLDLVLKSLASQNHILVSKDADSSAIDAVLKQYHAEVIEHPWSCSRHPKQFPAQDESLNANYKGDTYGNPRSSWATCLKHHWWRMMKQAWARKPERVCVLEDDTVIHPQAFQWLVSQSGNVKLTPDEIAVPWCMSAKEWQAIDPKTFCEHDDYNWDQTIAWMFKKDQTNIATVPTVSLSMHVGECGGWDAGGRSKECSDSEITAIQRRVEQWQMKFLTVSSKQSKWLTAHSKPNGGWGHPKDLSLIHI